jgi:hypothetical protein
VTPEVIVNPVLARLEAERQSQIEFIDRTLAEADEHQNDDGSKGRDLSKSEKSNLESIRTRIKQLDEQIAPLREFEGLRDAHQATTSQFTPTRSSDQGDQGRGGAASGLGYTSPVEPKYRSIGEFLADGFKAASGSPKVPSATRDAALSRLGSHGVTVAGGMLTRAAEPHNTTEEVPGLLPESIIGPVISDVDAARPFISSVGPKDLGGIPGLTFERPTITQHVEVAKQTDEKAEVANRQFTVGGIPFTKDTYGGWANVSRQSIDWTSPGVWDALMTDFIEQYALTTENAAADAFVAAVTAEQELTTAAAGTPTVPEILAGLYGAASKAYQGGGRLPNTIWVSLDQ